MCLDLYVHWVSRSMHLTELKQSDWVISALIINEFEKLRAHFYVISFTKNDLRMPIILATFNDLECML